MSASDSLKNGAEKLKGQVKETAGEVLDRPDLRKEGEAQQEKADAQQDADRLDEMAKEKQQEAFEREKEQDFQAER